jgi:hypothetical protein
MFRGGGSDHVLGLPSLAPEVTKEGCGGVRRYKARLLDVQEWSRRGQPILQWRPLHVCPRSDRLFAYEQGPDGLGYFPRFLSLETGCFRSVRDTNPSALPFLRPPEELSAARSQKSPRVARKEILLIMDYSSALGQR